MAATIGLVAIVLAVALFADDSSAKPTFGHILQGLFGGNRNRVTWSSGHYYRPSNGHYYRPNGHYYRPISSSGNYYRPIAWRDQCSGAYTPGWSGGECPLGSYCRKGRCHSYNSEFCISDSACWPGKCDNGYCVDY